MRKLRHLKDRINEELKTSKLKRFVPVIEKKQGDKSESKEDVQHVNEES